MLCKGLGVHFKRAQLCSTPSCIASWPQQRCLLPRSRQGVRSAVALLPVLPGCQAGRHSAASCSRSGLGGGRSHAKWPTIQSIRCPPINTLGQVYLSASRAHSPQLPRPLPSAVAAVSTPSVPTPPWNVCFPATPCSRMTGTSWKTRRRTSHGCRSACRSCRSWPLGRRPQRPPRPPRLAALRLAWPPTLQLSRMSCRCGSARWLRRWASCRSSCRARPPSLTRWWRASMRRCAGGGARAGYMSAAGLAAAQRARQPPHPCAAAPALPSVCCSRGTSRLGSRCLLRGPAALHVDGSSSAINIHAHS